jgi:hypothetical protein
MSAAWTETACRFPDDERIFGVICEPESTLSSARSAVGPVIVFISAGLLHDVGPYSLYVEMARRYATLGFTSLRMDLGGIGNSQPDTSASAEDAHVEDVITAMDFLESHHGCREFILCGLCSGAENAHRAAVRDSRVTGLLLLEGYIFPTLAYYLWHYLPRIVSWHRWNNFITNRLRGLRDKTVSRNDGNSRVGSLWAGEHSSQQQVSEELRLLCKRGVLQLQIFSGGTGDCSYAGQFQDAFRRVELSNHVAVRFFPDADHMYILRSDRTAMLRTVDQWLELYCKRMAVNPVTSKVGNPRRTIRRRPKRPTRISPAGSPAAIPQASPAGFNDRVGNDARTI